MQLNPESNALLLVWLKQQSNNFKILQRTILLWEVLKILTQTAGLYGIAYALNTMVINAGRPSTLALILIAVVFFAQSFCQWQANLYRLRLSANVLLHYQKCLQNVLAKSGMAVINDHSVAAWQSYFMKRLPALQGYFADFQINDLLARIVPLWVLVVLTPMSWLVALMLMLAGPVIPLFMWVVGKNAASAHRQHFLVLERLGTFFIDRLKARQLLHVHADIDRQESKFQNVGAEVRERTLKVLQLAFLSSSVLDFFATLGVALVAVFVGFSLLGHINFGLWQGPMQFQQGLFILLMAPLFFSVLKALGRAYHIKAEALGAAADIQPMLDTAKTKNNKLDTANASQLASDKDKLASVKHAVVVSERGDFLLQVPELSIMHGDHIWLAGASGAGKTVLLEALLKMRPWSGASMKLLDKTQVSWLAQDPVVLTGTLRENLSLGCAFSDEQMHGALISVGLEHWAKRQGLDKKLGEFPPMSGGEKQRLAIARSILFDHPIVIMDEPTAHLGDEQATQISDMLRDKFSDKTVIWVEHQMRHTEFFNKRWLVAGAGLPLEQYEGAL